MEICPYVDTVDGIIDQSANTSFIIRIPLVNCLNEQVPIDTKKVEIDVDEFSVAQAIARVHFANIEIEKSKLEDCEQTYQHFVRFHKVCDKELPLSEIIDEINEIRVDSGRKVMVQWK